MPNVDDKRLHQDEPLLIPGLKDFANWAGDIDLGTVDKRTTPKRAKKEGITEYRARLKRESRHSGRYIK